VSASTVIGRASLPGDLSISRISESMGIEPHEVVAGLKVAIGDVIKEGQLLCEHRGLFGLFRTQYHAQSSGTVEVISERTGHLAIRAEPRFVERTAYLAGRVVSVDPGRSVTIEVGGALVQGIFGIGGERSGTIRNLTLEAGAVVTPGDLPADLSGAIVVGGTSPTPDTLREAAARGAVGFVTGSIDDRTIADYLGYDLGIALTGDEDVSMTVIVTEGFGRMPFGTRALTLFRAAEGREASLNGATQVRAGALRPEIVIPGELNVTERSAKTAEPVVGLAIGALVRAIRVPYFGQIGEVVELPSEPHRIDTGAEVRVAGVAFADGQRAFIPRANLELQL
jgi:hypothetical protein